MHACRCTTTWDEITERSYIELEEYTPLFSETDEDFSPTSSETKTPSVSQGFPSPVRSSDVGGQRSATATDSRTAADNITIHSVWDRYLSVIQGRSSYGAIKFNGQSKRTHFFDLIVFTLKS
jgi:hypothetical protein